MLGRVDENAARGQPSRDAADESRIILHVVEGE